MNPLPQPLAPRTRRAQAGVAMIEVLIAILLFSLGVLGLLGLQARALSYSIDAEDRNRAALLANDAASIMWLKRSVTLTEDELEGWQTRVAAARVSGLPSGSGTIEPVAGTTNSADISITWRPPSIASDIAAQPRTFTTRVTLP